MLKLEPAALTDVGRKRSNNQDYLGDLIFKSGRKYGPEKLNERGHLFAVADGMGGYAGGEVASELAITTLFERFYNGSTSGDIGTDLSEAIRAANLKVHTEASGSGRPQMGTTLTTVLVKGNKAIFGNVGDSRTYLIRQGIAERVTHDHSLVQDQIDAGVLTPEQAERSAIKNFITRAIGHRDDVESDLFEREIQQGDVLLLCSDGLHGLVKEQEMGTIVATADVMQDAAQELVNLANERGGHDNISVMLIKVEDVGETLPNILNGREPIYNTNRNLYNQTTEPLGAVTASSATTISQSDRVTAPLAYPDATPLGASTAYSQPTAPMVAVSEPETKSGGGRGIVLGIIALLIIVAIGVIAYLLLFSSPAAPNPAAPATALPATGATPAAATPTVTSTPRGTTPAQTTVAALATATPPANPGSASGAAPQPTTGASGSFAGTTPTSNPAISTTVASDRPRGTTGPTEDQANVGSSTNCLNVTPNNNQICWQVESLLQVKQIRVTLTNPGSGMTLRLEPPNTSSAVTVPLPTVTSPTGSFEAPISFDLLPGQYTLVLSRSNGTTENFGIKVDNNKQVWADTGIDIHQENNALIIHLTNKTA